MARPLIFLLLIALVFVVAPYSTALERERLVRHLWAMREPILTQAQATAESSEIFRLVALPSFEGSLSIRVTLSSSGDAKVSVRTTSGPDYDLHFASERIRSLTREDVQALRASFSQINFWSLPTEAPPPPDLPDGAVGRLCLDGTTIVIEGIANGAYRMVHRSCSSDLLLAIEAFKRVARPLLPADVDEYVP